MAILVIASFLLSWVVFVFTGYFVTPLIPAFSPEPVISGYIGFFSGVIGLGIIPLIVLIWLLFKVIWGYEIGSRTRRGTFGVWMVSMFLFAATLIFGAKNFVHKYTNTEVVYEEKVDPDQPLILNLQSGYDDVFSQDIRTINLDDHLFISGGDLYLRNIQVELVPTQSDFVSIVKTSSATGQNRKTAIKSMNHLDPNIEISGNEIRLSDYTHLSEDQRFRMQNYRYTIKIPIKKSVQLKGSTDIIKQSEYVNGLSIYNPEKPFIMTAKGLELEEVKEI